MPQTTTKLREGGLLGAEELPRWFGLFLVLVCAGGLGATAVMAPRDARRVAAEDYRYMHDYALKGLAGKLARVATAGGSEAINREGYQRALREFAAYVGVEFARVVDAEGIVLATLDPTELGTRPRSKAGEREASCPPPAGWEQAPPIEPDAAEARTHCVPFAVSTVVRHQRGGRGDDGDKASNEATRVDYLSVRMASRSWRHGGLSEYTRTLTCGLVTLCALLVLYHLGRRSVRGASRVANRLQAKQAKLEQDLERLRIFDAQDAVTSAWNELLETAQGWLEEVRRTQATRELAEVLQRGGGGGLPEALHASPDGLMLITQEVRIGYINATACRLFGWDLAAAKEYTLAGAPLWGLGARALPLIRNALGPGGTFRSVVEIIESGGEAGGDSSSYRVQVIPLQRMRHEGACLVMIRDVSQQIRADKAREDFVAQVTHELRTPLTNIRAYTETLSSGMFEDPKVISDCYNVITKETRRLSRLIEDILSVSQLEVGSIQLAIDNVDLRQLLTDAVRDVRGLADAANIDLQLVLPAKMEPYRGDRDKLAVVLNNMLGNAIKYTPEGGNVIVGCQHTASDVQITIKDNGIGIDPADHARIFEKFQRADDPRVKAETGTGIGLYTAREIVRRHGGNIDVISKKGEGATFRVRLPLAKSRAVSGPMPREQDHG